mmetsp:Transcript_7734/g.23164  ORF Transcript_7734/g.23164 Transcript_7734/m.23164 type:complete len:357 (-) Transcript_7734:1253-2323(-)
MGPLRVFVAYVPPIALVPKARAWRQHVVGRHPHGLARPAHRLVSDLHPNWHAHPLASFVGFSELLTCSPLASSSATPRHACVAQVASTLPRFSLPTPRHFGPGPRVIGGPALAEHHGSDRAVRPRRLFPPCPCVSCSDSELPCDDFRCPLRHASDSPGLRPRQLRRRTSHQTLPYRPLRLRAHVLLLYSQKHRQVRSSRGTSCSPSPGPPTTHPRAAAPWPLAPAPGASILPWPRSPRAPKLLQPSWSFPAPPSLWSLQEKTRAATPRTATAAPRTSRWCPTARRAWQGTADARRRQRSSDRCRRRAAHSTATLAASPLPGSGGRPRPGPLQRQGQTTNHTWRGRPDHPRSKSSHR